MARKKSVDEKVEALLKELESEESAIEFYRKKPRILEVLRSLVA